MLAKRIIPCLDVTGGRVVKGTNFVELRDAGDPVELAHLYDQAGADELVFLDITATSDARNILLDLIERTAHCVHVPFTVGGGIKSRSDIRDILNAGADKISLNSAAIRNPSLLQECSAYFGAQCIIVAIDAKAVDHASQTHPTEILAAIQAQGITSDLALDSNSHWEVVINGGRLRTGIDTLKWAKWVSDHGAGEILLNSMDKDGTKSGYDLPLTRGVSQVSECPVIASGGAGTLGHIAEALNVCEAALLASLLHFRELSIEEIKAYCMSQGLIMRL